MAKYESLIETVMMESTLTVDRESGIIRNVKILGRSSPNKGGIRYSDKALKDAAKLYEGIAVNIDHPPRNEPHKERSYRDRFGVLQDCKTKITGDDKTDGTYGDLHFNRKHSLAEQVAEDAERFPKNLGLSHNANGELSGELGSRIVEGLVNAISVDIVTRPATNDSLFESQETEDMTMPKFKTRTVRQILDSAPSSDQKKRLHRLMEEDPGMVPPAMDVTAPETADPNEEVKLALGKAAQGIVKKIIDGDMDKSEGLKKLKEILGIAEKTMDNGKDDSPSPTPEPPSSGGEAVSESIKEELALLRKERKTREAERLLEQKEIEVTPKRVAALMEASEQTRTELLELWPKKSESRKLSFAGFDTGSLLESEENEMPVWASK